MGSGHTDFVFLNALRTRHGETDRGVILNTHETTHVSYNKRKAEKCI